MGVQHLAYDFTSKEVAFAVMTAKKRIRWDKL